MFSHFFIDRPIFATVLSIVIVIVGVVSLIGLPVGLYPEVVPPVVQVSTTYPGANASVVADTVAASIEQEINGVEDMLYMYSKSTNDGQLYIDVTFKVGTAAAQDACVATSDSSGVHVETLFAGQTIDAGTVSFEVTGSDLVVTYSTTGGWELQEVHLWVGDDLSNMPQTRKGNPKIGNFPYASGDISGDTQYQISVPLAVRPARAPAAKRLVRVRRSNWTSIATRAPSSRSTTGRCAATRRWKASWFCA